MEGIEPPLAVLETAVLPLNDTPSVNNYFSLFGSSTGSVEASALSPSNGSASYHSSIRFNISIAAAFAWVIASWFSLSLIHI